MGEQLREVVLVDLLAEGVVGGSRLLILRDFEVGYWEPILTRTSSRKHGSEPET